MIPTDVAVSAAPVTTWNSWVHDSIIPRLTTLSGLLNQLADIPRGCCSYDNFRFPSTEIECNLPNSTWSQVLYACAKHFNVEPKSMKIVRNPA